MDMLNDAAVDVYKIPVEVLGVTFYWWMLVSYYPTEGVDSSGAAGKRGATAWVRGGISSTNRAVFVPGSS